MINKIKKKAGKVSRKPGNGHHSVYEGRGIAAVNLTRRSHVFETGTRIDRGDKRTFEMRFEGKEGR